ncbi:MAG: KpsF/GutQ family sugar-phosphate isomerase [Proteobacteria bacterium]|nr:KpsF/GutQ family sugar-phosphate isomerase [Pseudomonadota bacterium]MBU1714979.1 KpsF/GutQ family sugar-phosphate isomerase [Pseudomonadota bacterium]
MYIDKAKEVLRIEAEGITSLLGQLNSNFNKAIDLIMACSGRVIITGIGKSGIIGQKISATLNSTGTSSVFLHPVEAMHGDLGLVGEQDVVLAISYSGETSELNLLLPSLKQRGVKVIAMTGNVKSSLAGFGDAVLGVAVPREACPLGLAPTASTTAALAMGDALSVVLLECKKFKASDFRFNHPGGSLGERLKVNVAEVMMSRDQLPVVARGATVREAVSVLNDKNLGAVLVIDGEFAVGIVTDGDIRRLISANRNLDSFVLEEIMTPGPKMIQNDLLAADALSIMQRHEITFLPVKDGSGRLVGSLHLQDLLGKGEFRFLV